MPDTFQSNTSQVCVLAVIASTSSARPRSSQITAMVVVSPPQTKYVRSSQIAALVPYARPRHAVPRASQIDVLVVWGTGQPVVVRSRAWQFNLDGHAFYVLDLGEEGTFLYDLSTGQWCEFKTAGFVGWNLKVGTMWGDNRIVGADAMYDYVWELSPDKVRDEDFRDLEHAVTGGIQTRSRVYISCEALRLSASVGQIDEVDGATLKMRFSDDRGKTWSNFYRIEMTEGDYTGELTFRSLGSFAMPGRIFEITDLGGLIRIDGADLGLDNFDEDQNG